MNQRKQHAPAPSPAPSPKMGRPRLAERDLSKSFTIRLRPENREWIDKRAASLDLSSGVFVRHALEALMDADKRGLVQFAPTDGRSRAK